MLAIFFNFRICCAKHPGGALDIDAKDWAEQILKAKQDDHAQKDPLERAAEAARRSAIAASDAAAAAAAAVSLSQREAGWHHPSPHAKQQASDGHQRSLISLAIASAEKKDAVKAYAAVSAAKAAAAEMQRAKALADSVEHTRKEISKLQQQALVEPNPTVSASEANLYQGETAAAETAAGCVIVLCIVICWFTSEPSEGSSRRRQMQEKATFFDRHRLLCCCCRRVSCIGHCVFNCASCIGHCSCATVTMLLTIMALLGFGFKSLWDRHLIQPHLEEATLYLFFGTIALTIILVLIGEFVRWLKEKLNGLTEFASYTRSKMDDVKDFLGIDDDDDEDSKSDVSVFVDEGLHASPADLGKLNRPNGAKAKPQQYQADGRRVERRQNNACGPGWWFGLLNGSRQGQRRNLRAMPKPHHDKPRDDSDMDAV